MEELKYVSPEYRQRLEELAKLLTQPVAKTVEIEPYDTRTAE